MKPPAGGGATRSGRVTGRVATRINLADDRTRTTPLLRESGHQVSAGWKHPVEGHYNKQVAPNRSVFTIPQRDLRAILQSDVVVKSPVTRVSGGQFVRTVDAQRRLKRQQRAQRVRDSLMAYLERVGAGKNDVRAFLEAVQQWLKDNLHAFSMEERNANGLDRYARLDLDPLPAMYTYFDPEEELAQLRNVPPSSVAGVAMSIETLFREGMTVLSRRECSDCESLMRVLEEEHTGRLGYECDVCTHAEDQDGASIQGWGRWGPATTETLLRRDPLLHSLWVPESSTARRSDD